MDYAKVESGPGSISESKARELNEVKSQIAALKDGLAKMSAELESIADKVGAVQI